MREYHLLVKTANGNVMANRYTSNPRYAADLIVEALRDMPVRGQLTVDYVILSEESEQAAGDAPEDTAVADSPVDGPFKSDLSVRIDHLQRRFDGIRASIEDFERQQFPEYLGRIEARVKALETGKVFETREGAQAIMDAVPHGAKELIALIKRVDAHLPESARFAAPNEQTQTCEHEWTGTATGTLVCGLCGATRSILHPIPVIPDPPAPPSDIYTAGGTGVCEHEWSNDAGPVRCLKCGWLATRNDETGAVGGATGRCWVDGGP